MILINFFSLKLKENDAKRTVKDCYYFFVSTIQRPADRGGWGIKLGRGQGNLNIHQKYILYISKSTQIDINECIEYLTMFYH